MNKDEHYAKTKKYMLKSAEERDGYYDAVDGAPLKHTVWQKRIRSLVLNQMARLIDRDPTIESVVDVGCGRGDFTLEIAGRFPDLERVDGTDFVDETLEIGRRAARGMDRVTFTEGDLLGLPFEDDSFGIVACINVLHHVHETDQSKALTELARIARGPLVFEIKNFDSVYYRYIHPKKLDDIDVYPTTADAVSKGLLDLGYRRTVCTGIFGFNWLSPLTVLVFEKV